MLRDYPYCVRITYLLPTTSTSPSATTTFTHTLHLTEIIRKSQRLFLRLIVVVSHPYCHCSLLLSQLPPSRRLVKVSPRPAPVILACLSLLAGHTAGILLTTILAPTLDRCVICICNSSLPQNTFLPATAPALCFLARSIQISVVRSDAREAVVP